MIPAIDLVGRSFRDGGRGPDAFDCWGLCLEVFRRAGIELKDYSVCCYDAERICDSFEEERTTWKRCRWPDVPVPAVVAIRFNEPVVNHVGIYVGEGKFLHVREKTGVVLELLDSPAWRHRIEGFYVPGDSYDEEKSMNFDTGTSQTPVGAQNEVKL